MSKTYTLDEVTAILSLTNEGFTDEVIAEKLTEKFQQPRTACGIKHFRCKYGLNKLEKRKSDSNSEAFSEKNIQILTKEVAKNQDLLYEATSQIHTLCKQIQSLTEEIQALKQEKQKKGWFW